MERLRVVESPFELCSARLVSGMQLKIYDFLTFFASIPNIMLSGRSLIITPASCGLTPMRSSLSCDDFTEDGSESGAVWQGCMGELAQYEDHVAASPFFRP
jgi:hypothetical protein